MAHTTHPLTQHSSSQNLNLSTLFEGHSAIHTSESPSETNFDHLENASDRKVTATRRKHLEHTLVPHHKHPLPQKEPTALTATKSTEWSPQKREYQKVRLPPTLFLEDK